MATDRPTSVEEWRLKDKYPHASVIVVRLLDFFDNEQALDGIHGLWGDKDMETRRREVASNGVPDAGSRLINETREAWPVAGRLVELLEKPRRDRQAIIAEWNAIHRANGWQILPTICPTCETPVYDLTFPAKQHKKCGQNRRSATRNARNRELSPLELRKKKMAKLMGDIEKCCSATEPCPEHESRMEKLIDLQSHDALDSADFGEGSIERAERELAGHDWNEE